MNIYKSVLSHISVWAINLVMTYVNKIYLKYEAIKPM